MRKTRFYFLSLTLPLFLLFLTVGTGMLSTREVAAQEEEEVLRDFTRKEDPFTKDAHTFYLQSMDDLAWKDKTIIQLEGKKQDDFDRCGCYLSALSSVMNYMVGGSIPHYAVTLDDQSGKDPWERQWNRFFDITPVHLDEYLTYGKTRTEGDEGLPRSFGYIEKGTGCGVKVVPGALTQAVRPIQVSDGSGQTHDIGAPGILPNEWPNGLKTRETYEVVVENILNYRPVIVTYSNIDPTTGAVRGKHVNIIVGITSEGHFLVLDPQNPSGTSTFNPAQGGEEEYKKWVDKIESVITFEKAPQGRHAIEIGDDPSPFEFLTIGPDGRRTGFDPETETHLKEDPAISNFELGGWADLGGEEPPGDISKLVDIDRPDDGTYRVQVTGTGDGQAKFYLATLLDIDKTVLKEVDEPITSEQLLKYELDYKRSGESTVSEVSNFTPEARPSVDSEPVAGDTLTFDGSDSFDADGTVESYEWDFGDGKTATGSAATHAYEKPGTYTVTLKVTDDQGETDTSTTEVEVAPTETDAPTTTVTYSPELNNFGWMGWSGSEFTVDLTADDGEGGSGVESITYSATGAQEIPETVVEGDSAQFEITEEGETTITYQAKDRMDNFEEEQSALVGLDKTAPQASVQKPADGDNLPLGGKSLDYYLISGTASDEQADLDVAFSGLFSVEVSLQRESDGLYWDGTNWVEGEQWLSTTRTDCCDSWPWSKPTGLPSGDLLTEGSYVLRSRATDQVGNKTANPVPVTFEVTEPIPQGGEGRIAFAQTGRDSAGNYIWAPYLMNADGTGQTKLALPTGVPADSVREGRLSPDGKKYAFIRIQEESNEVYVANVDGSGLTRLTNDEVSDSDVAWSWDSSKLAVNKDGDIYTIDADGSGEAKQVSVLSNSYDDSPAWSPGGDKIAFVTGDPQNHYRFSIYVMNADGTGGVTQITSGSNSPLNSSDAFPTWSPDGTKIAFVRTLQSDSTTPTFPPRPPSSNHEIYVASADGSNATNLTNHQARDELPVFSPDGEKIAFLSGRDGNPEVYVMDADGSNPDNITKNAAYNAGPISWGGASDATPTDATQPSMELPADTTEEATSKEGAAVTFAATATDEDPTNPEVTCSPASGTTFPRGETTVNCSATDAAGNRAEGSFKVTVKDTTPPETAIESGPEGPTEDNTPTFTFSGTDKVSTSANLLFSYRLDEGGWSDYSKETSATPGGSEGLGEGSHTFYVRAKDEAGNADADPAERSFTVEAANRPPTADAGGPYTVKEGSSVEVTASGSDPEGENLTYAWDLDDDGSFDDASTQSTTFDASNLDGPTTKTIEVQVSDEEGEKATDEATVTVTNAPPSATFNAPTTSVEEGSPFALSLDEPSDAAEADKTGGFTYAFDCGNGYGDYGSENEVSCSTDDNGERTIRGTIRDKDGDTSEYTASVEVNNLRPSITKISGPLEALTGKKASFTAGATDPSKADTEAGFSWEWAVDGGSYSSGSNPLEYAFEGCGEHTLSAKAKDKDGGVSEPYKSGVFKAYEGRFGEPLNEGTINTVQKGRVVPVKVTVGCSTNDLRGLKPTIQLLNGDKAPGTETGSDAVETYSSSAADTVGVMREVDGGYIYNLEVPTNIKNSDGSVTELKAGDLLTIRVRPLGDYKPEASMYVVLKIAK